jgi:hypothetical protein
MGDRPVQEIDLGTRTVDGRELRIELTVWPGGGLSYHAYDDAVDQCLTEYDAFDTDPDDEQLRTVMSHHEVLYNVEAKAVKLLRAASPKAAADQAHEDLDAEDWWADDYSKADVQIADDQTADGTSGPTGSHTAASTRS